jgi:hypothetical protein
MRTLIEDEELLRLRAMAEGSKPFMPSGLWAQLAALEQKQFMQLPPRERLGAGYYQAALRRREQMKR